MFFRIALCSTFWTLVELRTPLVPLRPNNPQIFLIWSIYHNKFLKFKESLDVWCDENPEKISNFLDCQK